MPTPKNAVAAPESSTSLLKAVRAKESAIAADLSALAKKYGPDVFRIAGQRYFKRQREEEALREEIAQREAELERLRKKSTR